MILLVSHPKSKNAWPGGSVWPGNGYKRRSKGISLAELFPPIFLENCVLLWKNWEELCTSEPSLAGSSPAGRSLTPLKKLAQLPFFHFIFTT
jgi:hypothetical protein